MITYFPESYPDELLYSVLARWYIKSGYLSYMTASMEIYKRKAQKPSIEFLNEMNDETVHLLTRHMTMEEVIIRHTMFPYYGRFLPTQRRKKLMKALTNMDSSCNTLGLPKSKNRLERFIRYCPQCAREDREKYGETYWHRTPQMIGIRTCPVHGCQFRNSSIIMNRNNTTVLIAAEIEIDRNGCAECGKPSNFNVSAIQTVAQDNPFDKEMSAYFSDVFQSAMNLEANNDAGEYLQRRIENTACMQGQRRNLIQLFSELQEWLPESERSQFAAEWQIQKIFENKRTAFDEICVLGMFLRIPAGELGTLGK